MIEWLKLDQFETSLERARAQMVYTITAFLVFLYTFILFVPINPATNDTFLHESTELAIYIVSFYLVAGITVYLLRTGRLELAGWGPVAMWVLGAYMNTVQIGLLNASSGIVLVILILLGGLLQSIKGLIVTTLGALIAVAVGVGLRAGRTTEELPVYITHIDDLITHNLSDLSTMLILIIGIGSLIYLFLRYAQASRNEGASQAVENRDVAAEVVTQIADRVAQREDLNALLDDVVNNVNEQFAAIYHTQVFLIDEETQEARLVASTGEVGRLLLERKHNLRVGSNSVIGQVTLRGTPVVARSGILDGVHKRNELLPETRVEAAFPLRLGSRIIGALDVQSKVTEAFDHEQVKRSLQVMADSITLAIDNVRQYDHAQMQLRENERLVQEAHEALHEVERLNERLIGQVWSDYLSSQRNEHALTYDFSNDQMVSHAEETSTLKDAMQINHLVQEQQGNQQVIAVPLRVRGRVIGAMEFELDNTQNFTPDDFDLVQEISERFGLAIENARLVDVSQWVAQRETLVNQISSRLQSTNNVEVMLNEAATSLYSMLNADKVMIQLGAPPEKAEGS